MNGVQTELNCKPNVKRCKRFVFPEYSPLLYHNTLKTKAIKLFQADHILTRFVFPPLSNAMFNINIVDYDDPFESYYNILEKYVSLINTMPDDPNSVMGTSANIIPQTLYLKHELLAKFRLFKWMYQNKYIDCKSFEELDIPPKLVNIQKDYVAMTRHIHSIDYIWDNMIFQHLINDIQYFASIHLISDETKEEIKNELFLLADELEELAINGKIGRAHV